jgi:hypothetical protein
MSGRRLDPPEGAMRPGKLLLPSKRSSESWEPYSRRRCIETACAAHTHGRVHRRDSAGLNTSGLIKPTGCTGSAWSTLTFHVEHRLAYGQPRRELATTPWVRWSGLRAQSPGQQAGNASRVTAASAAGSTARMQAARRGCASGAWVLIAQSHNALARSRRSRLQVGRKARGAWARTRRSHRGLRLRLSATGA